MEAKKRPDSVQGIHAPTPRFTPWAALLLACALSLLFLAGLGLWRLFF